MHNISFHADPQRLRRFGLVKLGVKDKMENSTLVKFGKKEHIEDLYNHGKLYMNNLPYFWKIEGDEARHDPNDGLSEYHLGTNGYATLKTPDGKNVNINITNWDYKIPPKNPDKINLFCMYALRLFHGSFPVDIRNFELGDSALVLLNGDEFIKRVADELIKQSIIGESDLVEYVANNYTGRIGPFRKREKFKYQSEWRIVCLGGDGNHRELYIGSLKDISRMIPAKEINTEIIIIPNKAN